jgi:hypothetical protein
MSNFFYAYSKLSNVFQELEDYTLTLFFCINQFVPIYIQHLYQCIMMYYYYYEANITFLDNELSFVLDDSLLPISAYKNCLQ